MIWLLGSSCSERHKIINADKVDTFFPSRNLYIEHAITFNDVKETIVQYLFADKFIKRSFLVDKIQQRYVHPGWQFYRITQTA